MVKVAILGFGTVGAGVAEVLAQNAQGIAARACDAIELKYILDIRDFPDSPFADRVIHDFDVIENDPEVAIVIETIGGQRWAYDYTRRALAAGKSVVTSNKELVAERGAELLELAREKGVNYFFEAAVGGGIPILRPLVNDLAANEITEITGILNGTTNYILTRMLQDCADFADALREAQANGYAEADPTADIEGHDACRKICILADLAYGHEVKPESVTTEGITTVTQEAMAFALAHGYTIKLLGRVFRRADGRIHILVAPHMIPLTRPIASVNGVFNGISVTGNAVDELMFYGRGAGKLPTASAVVADVIDAAKHPVPHAVMGWRDDAPDFVAPTEEMVYRWCLRLTGCTADAALTAFPNAAVLADDTVALITAPTATGDVNAAVAALTAAGAQVQTCIRILD